MSALGNRSSLRSGEDISHGLTHVRQTRVSRSGCEQPFPSIPFRLGASGSSGSLVRVAAGVGLLVSGAIVLFAANNELTNDAKDRYEKAMKDSEDAQREVASTQKDLQKDQRELKDAKQDLNKDNTKMQ